MMRDQGERINLPCHLTLANVNEILTLVFINLLRHSKQRLNRFIIELNRFIYWVPVSLGLIRNFSTVVALLVMGSLLLYLVHLLNWTGKISFLHRLCFVHVYYRTTGKISHRKFYSLISDFGKSNQKYFS